MSRNFILGTGALLWAAVVLDAIVHFAMGDLVIPVLMLVVSVTWVGLRRGRLALLKAEAA
jgi:hypothetical protein